ncbi:PREDICTED: trimethyllysine dioxygenase, mitochondrial [Drosophila arizonae]|uniref:Trimethyllysine dioxygenase, mitochondrial n=1 Tax=Drosophila arizonae TaxID=7263 RepID=A0ABM1Q5Q4_DROAR|nr:PREDICTED: trimethyllysine dioxygenase, mitochondrial [Drosophila arizonae]XP_017874791.1 PREDICTED: trimethyllysine dioxygenase, mitochondrial [Drosophila arizonae]
MLQLKHAGSGQVIELDEFWLRYHCHCGDCLNTETHQRRYDVLELPADVYALRHSWESGDKLLVEWSDGHRSSYDWAFIYDSQLEQLISRRTKSTALTPWNRSIVLQNERHLRFSLPALVASDEQVKQLVGALVRYGIVFIDDVAPTPTMTELALRRCFPIMKTFFGEMWTFSDKPDHADTAYTKMYLGSHTDNTYFCDAAGLQALHCLDHSADGTGGENFFVDGLHLVQELRRRFPAAYEVLCRVQVPAEYIEQGQHHCHTAPIIRIDPLTGELLQLRLNVYDRAVFNTLPQREMASFYASLRQLLQMVREEEQQWQLKLRPGSLVIFDNWRVLHGRHAYTGRRIMCGAYVQRTDYQSKARILGLIE